MIPSIGDRFISKYNYEYTVVGYNKYDSVSIIYDKHPEHVITTSTTNIYKGIPPNPFRAVVCGLGYHGIGHSISTGGIKKTEYIKWHGMLSRCYGTYYSERGRKSVNCYKVNNIRVHPDWFNYQNFHNWWNDNICYFNGRSEIACLDSDLLEPSLNMYSEESCCILPYSLNISIQLASKMWFNPKRKLYEVNSTRTAIGKGSYLGRCETEEEAWLLYSKAKDKYIHDSYINLGMKLPPNVEYNLLNFRSLDRLKALGIKV